MTLNGYILQTWAKIDVRMCSDRDQSPSGHNWSHKPLNFTIFPTKISHSSEAACLRLKILAPMKLLCKIALGRVSRLKNSKNYFFATMVYEAFFAPPPKTPLKTHFGKNKL